MQHLMDMGVTTRTEMKRHLRTYVREKWPEARSENASYYPSDKTVGRNMYKIMMRLRHSKLDEENVVKMIEIWKKKCPHDLIYFRPKTLVRNCTFRNTEDEDDILYHVPSEQNVNVLSCLLFVHMSVAQKLLLERYPNLVLMDATYRTCRLMLPLFILAVKTNVNYSPVATFIVQNEDSVSISEALSRIKAYVGLDGIQIKNFMIDCSPTEMQSIRTTFPDCGIYLCDFHRNQCWGRWLRATANGVSKHYELLMSIFKKLGESVTVQEYKRHQEYLRSQLVYIESKKLQDYYKRWEKNKEVILQYLCFGCINFNNMIALHVLCLFSALGIRI